MKKIIIIMGMLMALGSVAHADRSLVTIKNAEKVFIKAGMSHHKALGMVKCLLTLKKFSSADKALEAAMTKVKEKCTKHAISDEKCKKLQFKMAKKVHHCFLKKEFIEEFFKSAKTE